MGWPEKTNKAADFKKKLWMYMDCPTLSSKFALLLLCIRHDLLQKSKRVEVPSEKVAGSLYGAQRLKVHTKPGAGAIRHPEYSITA